jgi:tRNA-modifying protein YgfZ
MPINSSTSSAIFHWKPACWLRVTGDDAGNFLQGQFTNDLRLLDRQVVIYGLWLTLKGKVLGDSFVLRGSRPDEFWIGSYFSMAGVIRERLESYVIADDVTIEDVTSEWAGISVCGDALTPPTTRGELSASLIFPGRRDRGANVECVYNITAGVPAEILALNAVEVNGEEMMRRRIVAGIPAIPVDLGPTDLPNEAGLEPETISYTKGCYLGQEVMARLKSMGQVRRRLWRVRGEGEHWPSLPAPVFGLSRQVGELRSAARDGAGGWVGMAMVSLLHVEPATALSFAAGAPPALRLNAEP